MATVTAPIPAKAEADIVAWNQNNAPWPSFVAAVREAVKQFPNPEFKEFPGTRRLVFEEDDQGTRVLVEEWRGKILIGTIQAKVTV